MSDWILIDYGNPDTWPATDQHIEGLRWLGASTDPERRLWLHSTGTVQYVNLPGFPVQEFGVAIGFALRGGSLWSSSTEPEPGYPEPPEAPTDWWRPLEEPDAVR